MGARRRARECALQILFGLDWTAGNVDDAIDLFWTRFAGERPTTYEEVRHRCAQLVRGVVARREDLDKALADSSHNWKIERMSVVDRNLLRVAAFELLFMEPQPPRNVVLNEAVEIAKKFGSEDSSAFVNGVLHQLAEAHKIAGDDDRKKRRRRVSGPAPKNP
jgi:transcription antitermination protein NusB